MRSQSWHASDAECSFNIPNHKLYRRIGQGSSGEVWLATDAMNKWRAVKIVSRAEDGHEGHSYEREFNAIKLYEDICHLDGSLMPIIAVGLDPATRCFFYSMELADNAQSNDRLKELDGNREQISALIQGYKPRTLREELRRRGRFPPAECVEYGFALATALRQLHAHGLIHRDIKPDNIIFAYGRPKLADVGLVADVDATYSLAGTAAYLSPEPTRKEPADIYALGKVLYEMVTGRRADEYPALPKDFGAFTENERTAFNEFNAVVVKACAFETSERHSSAKDLCEELQMRAENRSVVLVRELEERDFRRRRFIRRLAVTCAILAGLLLFTFLGIYVWTTRRTGIEEARRRELREIRIARLRGHQSGWSVETWARLDRAAAVGMDQEIIEQATAALTGLDARRVALHRDLPTASAAFAADGRALFGGAENSPAILVDTNGALTELPTRGEGPVYWTSDNQPMQLVALPNALVLRNVLDGKVRRELSLTREEQSFDAVRAILAVTPEGTRVAAGSRDRVIVWETASGEKLGEVAIQASSLGFSPDGSLLAAGSTDGTTRVYDLPQLREAAVLPPAVRGNPILCLAFGPDRIVPYRFERKKSSWLLATGDQGAAIVIWDLTRRMPRSFCLGSTWNVQSLAFHPDGLTLASAGRNEPRFWDVMSGQLLLRLDGASSGDSRAIAFDQEGRRIVFGGESGAGRAVATLWEVESHRGIQVLRGLASAVRKVWFSRNSRRVAALSDDWHLAVWDTATSRMLFNFETPVGATADNSGGSFDTLGNQFAFATGIEACLFDIGNGEVIQRWTLQPGRNDQLCFDPRGQLRLLRRERASEQRKSIWRLYDLKKSQNPVLLHEQTKTNWTAIDMAFRPGGEQFLVWNGEPDKNRMIRAYDVASGRDLWELPFASSVGQQRVFLDPTGRWFGYVAVGEPETRHLMNFSTQEKIGTTTNLYEAMNPTAKQFAGNYGGFYPDNAGKSKPIPLALDWHVNANVCAFSPDGRLLAHGTGEGPVLVADLQEVLRRVNALGKIQR